jgi:hypothetical protein
VTARGLERHDGSRWRAWRQGRGGWLVALVDGAGEIVVAARASTLAAAWSRLGVTS